MEGARTLNDMIQPEGQSLFGCGFSTTNLHYFRTFYTVYVDRLPEIRQIGASFLASIEQEFMKRMWEAA
ncbi:MAG: hypothetical protein V1782_11290 [Pseudomonadota bacterium]